MGLTLVSDSSARGTFASRHNGNGVGLARHSHLNAFDCTVEKTIPEMASA